MENQIIQTSRLCPICGNGQAALLFRQSFEGPAAATLLAGYDVVVCSGCGAAYADRIPPQSVFNDYYRDLSKYENSQRSGKESSFDDQRFRDVAIAVEPFIPGPQARVVEIGCATGRQLDLIRQRGFSNIRGIDPSPGCAEAAEKLYRVPVTPGTIFNLSAVESDFLIASHVLEHIVDLSAAIQSMAGALSEKGRIYIEVPDATRMVGRADAPYQEFSTEHINFFSPQSLANLFSRHGFAVVAVERTVRQQNHGTTCPAVWSIFERANPKRGERDTETEPALRRYIDECGARDRNMRARILEAVRGRRIIVWGVGTHTQRLLATGGFEGVEIALFVDSNSKYQGQTLHGIPVANPNEITGRDEPILISSHGFQREISHQIRENLRMQNELITLYES